MERMRKILANGKIKALLDRILLCMAGFAVLFIVCMVFEPAQSYTN